MTEPREHERTRDARPPAPRLRSGAGRATCGAWPRPRLEPEGVGALVLGRFSMRIAYFVRSYRPSSEWDPRRTSRSVSESAFW